MSNDLKTVIEKAANEFALVIVAAIKGATFQEISALQGAAAPKRGRKPGRKPGRPPKAGKKLRRPAKITKGIKKPAKKRAKMDWPKCKHPSCKKNAWRRGQEFCGEHFKALGVGKKQGKKAKKQHLEPVPF